MGKEIKIEKGINIPTSVVVKEKNIKYPFYKMEDGDSFLFSTKTDYKTEGNARSQCNYNSKKYKCVFKHFNDGKEIRIFRMS